MTDQLKPMANSPIVLIHGVGLDRTMWEPVASLLRGDRVDPVDREVVAYDMLGHGEAQKPTGPYELSMFVDQLAALVDSLSRTHPAGTVDMVNTVDLVGFSMGALVAQGFAIDHPDRVRRLALLHSVFDRTDDERAAIVARVEDVRSGGFLASIPTALARWFTPAFTREHPEVIASVRRVLEANDVDAYASAYEVFATADAILAERTSLIRSETLVLTGEDDQRSTPSMSRHLAAALQQGEAIVLPNLRHLAPLEDPPLVASVLRSFLDR